MGTTLTEWRATALLAKRPLADRCLRARRSVFPTPGQRFCLCPFLLVVDFRLSARFAPKRNLQLLERFA
jgi:hypothetical protein